jgi:hypothetical protein
MDVRERLDFILLFNSVNFCYWGSPKWTVEYGRGRYDGAWGMLAALRKALDAKVPLLDAAFLEAIREEQMREVLRGSTEIPLFRERLGIFRETGRILREKYDGHAVEIVNRGKGNALRMLDLIVNDFPSFNDCASYKGFQVQFHKRAQLATGDMHRMCEEEDSIAIEDVDRLTAFADYKIPQVLRNMGILRYSKSLSDRIDRGIFIPAGSGEEIEIRAHTIRAVELMKRALSTTIPGITAMAIDSCLWLRGQEKSPHDKPYHLTKTIAY